MDGTEDCALPPPTLCTGECTAIDLSKHKDKIHVQWKPKHLTDGEYSIIEFRDNQTKKQKDSSTQIEQKMKAMVGCPHERIYLKYKYEE